MEHTRKKKKIKAIIKMSPKIYRRNKAEETILDGLLFDFHVLCLVCVYSYNLVAMHSFNCVQVNK